MLSWTKLIIFMFSGTRTAKAQMASHDYTIKIVPTVFTSKNKKTTFGYQYTSVYKEFNNPRGTPAIWFRYELSPITVKYTEKVGSQKTFSKLTKILEKATLSFHYNYLCDYGRNVYCCWYDRFHGEFSQLYVKLTAFRFSLRISWWKKPKWAS